MRLFVGIALDGPARESVFEAHGKLVAMLPKQGTRFVRPEKLHLTLAFLGDVPEGDVPKLQAALEPIAKFPALGLETTEIGCFPDAHRPKVIWVGLGGDLAGLEVLALEVSRVTAGFGDHGDDKEFTPHVTLARIKPGSKVIGRLLAASPIEMPASPFPVGRVTLFQSKPDGTYGVLHEIQLQD